MASLKHESLTRLAGLASQCPPQGEPDPALSARMLATFATAMASGATVHEVGAALDHGYARPGELR